MKKTKRFFLSIVWHTCLLSYVVSIISSRKSIKKIATAQILNANMSLFHAVCEALAESCVRRVKCLNTSRKAEVVHEKV